jgi:hypothetical protein
MRDPNLRILKRPTRIHITDSTTHPLPSVMSLFASAFETGTVAGPSNALATASKGKNKRKRPGHGSSQNNGNSDHLRVAQQNLEKLMKSVDAGQGGNSGSKDRRREAKNAKDESAAQASRGSAKKTKLDIPKSGSGSKKANPPEPPKRDKLKKKQSVPIPISLAVPSIDETAGLTNLQKGMKTKLESARFRWVHCSGGAHDEMDQRAIILVDLDRCCRNDAKGSTDLCRCTLQPLLALTSSITRVIGSKRPPGLPRRCHILSTASHPCPRGQ